MNTTRLTNLSIALAAATLLAASCGGASDDGATADTADSADTVDAAGATADTVDTAETSGDTTSTTSAETDSGIGSIGDFEPGDVAFRVVNVLDEPVDIYVRTTGIVEAFAVESNVEPGAVTDLTAPPTDGSYIVTTAGAGDPTCVTGCDHFVAELSAFEATGPVHTALLYTDDRGEAAAFDLWEQPEPGSSDSANSMPPADPRGGVAVVTAIAVPDNDFGLRLAVDGTPGCLEPFNLENVLIGGNQTPAFVHDGNSVDYVVHDNADRECIEEPVGGPFTIDAGPGERSHLFLTGEVGDLDAIVVPMVGTENQDTADGGDTASADPNRDFAIEQMTIAVSSNLPLDDAQAACTAVLLVDAIGTDVLVVDGEFVDLDSLPTEFDPAAEQAIFQAITDCDIDPSLLGG